MANVLTGNPLVIDTAGAGVLRTDHRVLRRVRWVGATTAAHAAVVQDAAGNLKWRSVASGSSYVEADTPNIAMLGLVVPTLGSGILYLYFD